MQSSGPQEESSGNAVDSVIGALYSAGRLIRQRASGIELDPGSFWLLKALATHGPQRITELAGCASLDPSTISRQVTHLERAGLVERTPDQDDRRAQLIAVSDAGRDRLQIAIAKRRDLLATSFQNWHASEITDFARLLSRFVTDLENLASQEKE